MSSTEVTKPPGYAVINTSVNYHLDPKDGESETVIVGTASSYRRRHDPHTVQAYDIRGHEEDFSLDKQGFEYRSHPPIDFDVSEEHTKTVVYSEIAEYLKKA